MRGAGPSPTGEPVGSVSVQEVAELRALLRRDDVSARRVALGRLRRWRGVALDDEASAAVLAAVPVAYPWVAGERVDPAELLASLLHTRPRAVDPADVEAAYHMSGERVRASLLHLLALRRDRRGLAAVVFLLGPDGPTDLLPPATSALLDPLLDLDDLVGLPTALAGVVGRNGWAWHASDLLRRLVLDGRLGGPMLDEVVERVRVEVVGLLDAVDRLMPTHHLDTGLGGDLTREDRRRLVALVRFLEASPTECSVRLLHRVLAAADPRSAAVAVVALTAQRVPVAPDRVALVARDPEARALLLDGLDDIGRPDLLPAPWRSAPARAEADLVRWLAGETELGAAPHEVEHLGALPAEPMGRTHPSVLPGGREPAVAHLFRFRLRAPHWSSERGWMVGASGCWSADGHRVGVPFAHSLYRAEDDLPPARHLEAIVTSLVGPAPPA